MSKKTKKILLVITALIAVIIVASAVLIKIYITPESVKAFLIPKAEKALNRKVNIGEVNISLFKGIEIKDFAIKEKDEKTDFIKCKDFILKYRLLPLLTKKVIIEELKLVSPQVRIVRDRKGKFNFEGIGQQQKAPDGKKEKQAADTKGLPISLLVDSVVVENAGFSFLDLKKELPDIRGSIDIDMGIKSAAESELSSQGSIDLKLDEIVTKKPSEKHIKNITAGIKYAASVNFESNNIRIDMADIKVQKIPASITGKIANFKTLPEIDITVSIPETKTADIQESLASFADLKGLALSGRLKADLKLSGIIKKFTSLKTKGSVILEKVGITYNNIKAVFDGSLKFKGQSMDINVKGTVGKNTAELKGSVNNYFKNQEIKLNLYSNQLFLDELIPVKAKDKTPAKKSKPTPRKTPPEAKPLDLKLSAEGEVRIKSAKYKGMTMSDFYARYQLKNNEFKIIKMTAYAGKGKFNLKSVVDISKPGYIYKLSGNLVSLHADEVVNSLFPKAKNTVYGILSLNLKLNGSGMLPERIKRNLIANGDFNIKEGKITGNKITENLALFLGVDELKTINFKKAEGTLRVKNGTARLDSIFSSDDISMDPKGTIGLLDGTLNLAFDLKLSPRLTDKALKNPGIASYIKDEEGWGRIPIKISGTFSAPSYKVDVVKAGKRIIKKKAKELLEDLFDKDKDETKDTKDQEPDVKKPIKDLLKGLFE